MIGSRVLRIKCHRVLSCVLLSFVLIVIIDVSGIFRHLKEKPFQDFTYPLEVPNFIDIVQKFRRGDEVDIVPINNLYSRIAIKSNSIEKCNREHPVALLVMVKSAPSNSKNRNAVRETWKGSVLENNGKLLFFIGNPSEKDATEKAKLVEDIKSESSAHQDIVHLRFGDSYYNNTIKTMLEMRWATEECSNFSYALLVDDDYFVSIKNLLQFLKAPLQYPAKENSQQLSSFEDKLYAGYKMFPPPHRHKIFTKWYMPLEEYPYDYFPPYITAGAILLSRNALLDVYFASYFTAHFRFDDIYVAICAKKMNITPTGSEYFRFWTTQDESPEEFLIASHGFSDPERLRRFWGIQKSHGFC